MRYECIRCHNQNDDSSWVMDVVDFPEGTKFARTEKGTVIPYKTKMPWEFEKEEDARIKVICKYCI